MEQVLNADFFRGNRRRMMEHLPAGSVAVVPAHRRMQRNRDVNFRFRQDSNFYYLTGLESPDCLLVVTTTEELLIVPDKDSVRQLWEGGASRRDLSRQSGIKRILEWREASPVVGKIVKKAKTVYYPLPPKKPPAIALNPAQYQILDWLKHKWPSAKYKNLSPTLARLRMIKQPAEIASIKEAIRLTQKALNKAHRVLQAGSVEYELAVIIETEFLKAGASEAFPSIVATGSNACTIHYETGSTRLRSGELVLFDVGAEVNNCAADISRTVPVSGRMNSRQRAVYDVVKQVQAQAMKLLKPGIKLADYERKVAELMKTELVKLKLLKKSSISTATT